MKTLLLLFLFCFTQNVRSAKLLVFSVSNSKSHMLSNGRIAESLHSAGHDVAFLSIEHTLSTTNFSTTKNVKVVTMGRIPEERLKVYKEGNEKFMRSLFEPSGIFDYYNSMIAFSDGIIEPLELALTEDRSTIEKLKAEKFDAIFYESLFPHGCSFGHLFGIKVHFLVHSAAIFEYSTRLFGIPTPSGYVPTVGLLAHSDKMTFFERAKNLMETELANSCQLHFCRTSDSLFRKHFGADFPCVETLMKQYVPMQFVSADTFIDFPRPVFHNVIYIGGLGMKMSTTEKQLQYPFDAEMKKGKNGVIFFSLGSNVDSSYLPSTVKKNLIDAFESFPDYHFIVKLEASDDYGINYAKTKSNIFVTNWAPQSQLLKHSNLKLFITHGGLNSLLEVAHSGKPILLIPMIYDQIRNGQIVERNGWGKVLNKMEMLNGKDKFGNLIDEMLKNEKYQKSAVRIKHLLETKPFSADELFTKNVKFVLENGGKLPELQPASMDMNLFMQYNIDIYLAVIFVMFLSIGFCIFVIILVAKLLRSLRFSNQLNKKKMN